MSKLGNVSRGRLKAPHRYLIYGAEGCGKSTLAAHAPSPIWIDAEDGSGHLDVARYPFGEGPTGHVPRTYAEVLSAIDDLETSKHDYKSVVFDTLDRIEHLLWGFILERDSKPSAMNKTGAKLTSLESYGFGKGHQVALDEWRVFCSRIDRLRAKTGVDVIFLCHAQVRPYKNPSGDDYDRYTLRLSDKSAGFIKEWCDVVGYACFEEGAAETSSGRIKGFSTGKRLLKFERDAAFDAKSRLALPKQIELNIENPWAPLAAAVNVAEDPDTLVAAITAELERIGDADLNPKVEGAVKQAAGDAASLSRFLNSLKQRKAVEHVQQ